MQIREGGGKEDNVVTATLTALEVSWDPSCSLMILMEKMRMLVSVSGCS